MCSTVTPKKMKSSGESNREKWTGLALSRPDSARQANLECAALSPHGALLNLAVLDSMKHQIEEYSQVQLPKYIPLGGETNTLRISLGSEQTYSQSWYTKISR